MASLTETLATAKPTKAYSSAGYGATLPSVQSPYPPVYGARVNYGPTQGDQSLYANLLARTQSESARAVPSSTYSAQYNYDPILARLSALSQMTVANARDEAANLGKRAVIETGDEGLARELAADDPNTIAAAKANEFGTRQLLDRDYADRTRQSTEALNNANLRFSGTYIDEMAKQQFGMRQAETDYTSRFRDLFGGIQQQLLMREEAERQAMIDAQIKRGLIPGSVGGVAGVGGVGGAGAPVVPGPIAPMPSDWISSGPAMIGGPSQVAPPVAPPLVQPFPGGNTTSNFYTLPAVTPAPSTPPLPGFAPGTDPFYDPSLAAALASGYRGPI